MRYATLLVVIVSIALLNWTPAWTQPADGGNNGAPANRPADNKKQRSHREGRDGGRFRGGNRLHERPPHGGLLSILDADRDGTLSAMDYFARLSRLVGGSAPVAALGAGQGGAFTVAQVCLELLQDLHADPFVTPFPDEDLDLADAVADLADVNIDLIALGGPALRSRRSPTTVIRPGLSGPATHQAHAADCPVSYVLCQ